MSIYYRGGDALVTSEHFVWHPPAPPRRAAGPRPPGEPRPLARTRRTPVVRPIGEVAALRPGWREVTVRGWAPRPLVQLTSLPVAALAGLAAALSRGTAWVVPAVVVAAIALAAALWDNRYRRVGWALCSRGQILYQSADRRIFNQLCRALQRAVEQHSDAP